MEEGEQNHEIPSWAHRKLERYANWGVQILVELTTATRVGPDKVKIAAMPKSAVRHTQGLAVMKKTKNGVVLSFTQERAFVINKLVSTDGSIRWSAPVFMRGAALGLGFSLGYMTTGTCLALMNSKAVDNVTTSRRDWGCNWNFLVDMNGSRLKKVTFDSAAAPSQVVTDRTGGMVAKYYKVDAALVDMSFRGGRLSVNWDLNRATYGPDVDLAEVLAGHVPPPPQFQPVYDLLAQFIAETAPPPRMERRGSRHELRNIGGASGGSSQAAERELVAASAMVDGAALGRQTPMGTP